MQKCIRCHKDMEETPFCPWCGSSQAQQAQRQKKRRGNGQGSIFKRKGKKDWTVKITEIYYVDENGKKKQRQSEHSGFKTKAEAEKFCALYYENIANKAKCRSLEYYWSLFRDEELTTLSETRQRIYHKAWERLKPLHAIPVDRLTIEEMRACVSAPGLSYYPAKAIKTLLSQAFHLAHAEGFADPTILQHIHLPKLEEESRDPFSPDELKALWAAYEAGVPNADIPLIMIYTGMMPGELLRLTRESIDFTTRQIVGIGLKTKARRKLSILFPGIVEPLLRDRCQNLGAGEKLINLAGKAFYRAYYSALDQAGVRPLAPYSCRHTTGTALGITENVAPQTIQRILRWQKGTSSKIMDVYITPSDSDAKEALERMAANRNG